MATSIRTLLLVGVCVFLKDFADAQSYGIDYDNNQFLLDGEPFRYVSGSVHYFRVPRDLWADRLHKMRMGGINVLQTYIEWRTHEPEPNEFRFEGQEDVVEYIRQAQEQGLLVNVRAGPYICAERDMGGMPYWLLKDPNMEIRTPYQGFMDAVERYMSQLLPRLVPLLYQNGGPILGVQVENEYGNYGCDHNYTGALRDMFRRYLGDEVLLYTTDGANEGALECGKIPGVYATVDSFGMNAELIFRRQRMIEPAGPLVNSEFYPGIADHWGSPDSVPSPQDQAANFSRRLDGMLALNASVNIYMYHGGSNFDFSSGANSYYDPLFFPVTTSYDFLAPLSEAGDPNDKYFAVRDVIGKYLDLPNGTLPQPSPKLAFGPISLSSAGSILELVPVLMVQEPVVADYPLSFEDLNQANGYVMYEKVLLENYDDDHLKIRGLHDRAYVYINDSVLRVLERPVDYVDFRDTHHNISITASEGDVLRIVVENQGRDIDGPGMSEQKGITESVSIGDSELVGQWTHYSLPLNNTDLLLDLDTTSDCAVPAAFTGSFMLPNSTVLDTYLDTKGWGKGVAIVNGVNLGRHWPKEGPQITLYVPSVYLNPYPATNSIVMVEFERTNCAEGQTATVTFTDVAKLDAYPSRN